MEFVFVEITLVIVSELHLLPPVSVQVPVSVKSVFLHVSLPPLLTQLGAVVSISTRESGQLPTFPAVSDTVPGFC